MILLAFNLLLKLVESLNHPHGYHIKIPIGGSEYLLPVDCYLCSGQKLERDHQRQIDQYFLDRSCKIVYDDSDGCVVCEVVALHTIEWKGNLVLKEQEALSPLMKTCFYRSQLETIS